VHALVAPSVWWAEVTLAINRLATAVIMRLVFAAIASAVTAWCWALSKIKTEHKNMMSRKDGTVEEHLESIYQFQQQLLEVWNMQKFRGHNLHLVGEFVEDVWNKRAREDIWS